MVAPYIISQTFSTCRGSTPIKTSPSPLDHPCEVGASMIAFTMLGGASTSPTPTIPSSVWTLTTRSSCDPSMAASATLGRRRGIASILVISIFARPILLLAPVLLLLRRCDGKSASSRERIPGQRPSSLRRYLPEDEVQIHALAPPYPCDYVVGDQPSDHQDQDRALGP